MTNQDLSIFWQNKSMIDKIHQNCEYLSLPASSRVATRGWARWKWALAVVAVRWHLILHAVLLWERDRKETLCAAHHDNRKGPTSAPNRPLSLRGRGAQKEVSGESRPFPPPCRYAVRGQEKISG